MQTIRVIIVTGYHFSSCTALAGVFQIRNILPLLRFKAFINPKLISLTLFTKQLVVKLSPPLHPCNCFCQNLFRSAGSGIFFEACIIKVVTRNVVCIPASFPLCLTLNHMCDCFHCSVICFAVSTCWLVFKNNSNLLKRHIFHYLIRIGSFLTSSDILLQSKQQMICLFLSPQSFHSLCSVLCIPFLNYTCGCFSVQQS